MGLKIIISPILRRPIDFDISKDRIIATKKS